MSDDLPEIDFRAAMEQNARAAIQWTVEYEIVLGMAEALQARVAELEAQRDQAIALAEKAQEHAQVAQSRWESARDGALEDAANAAEEYADGIVDDWAQQTILWAADEIRAMKSGQAG